MSDESRFDFSDRLSRFSLTVTSELSEELSAANPTKGVNIRRRAARAIFGDMLFLSERTLMPSMSAGCPKSIASPHLAVRSAGCQELRDADLLEALTPEIMAALDSIRAGSHCRLETGMRSCQRIPLC